MRIPNVENQVPWDYTVEVRGYEVPLLKPSDVDQDTGGDGARRGGAPWLLRVAVRILRWCTIGVTDGAELRGIVRRQVRSAVHPSFRGILDDVSDAELRTIANKYQAAQADWELRCRQAIQRLLTQGHAAAQPEPTAPPSPRATRSVPKPSAPPGAKQGDGWQQLRPGAPVKVPGGSLAWGSARPPGSKPICFGPNGPMDLPSRERPEESAPSAEEIEREREAWREKRDELLEPIASFDFTESDGQANAAERGAQTA